MLCIAPRLSTKRFFWIDILDRFFCAGTSVNKIADNGNMFSVCRRDLGSGFDLWGGLFIQDPNVL